MFSNLQVESSKFRRALGNFCTGIVIITGYDGLEPIGFTAQSLVSLSLDPPLVGFSPAKTSRTWQRLRASGHFCVNILTDDQRAVCDTFASYDPDRFLNVAWRECASGLPVIDGSLAYIYCTLDAEHETGDHTFVVGRVGELDVLRPQDNPLLFFRGSIRSDAQAQQSKRLL